MKWNKDVNCLSCAHFSRSKYGTCKAFPEGIPHLVQSGEVSHLVNIEGDNGIKFKLVEKR